MDTKNFSFISILFLIVIVLTNVGCKKDNTGINNPPAQTCLIGGITDYSEDGSSSLELYEYDANRRVTRLTFNPDFYITYFYSSNRVVQKTYLQNTISQRVYDLDADGYVETVTDDDGSTWDYYYDDNGYLMEVYYSDFDNSDKDYELVYSNSGGNIIATAKWS